MRHIIRAISLLTSTVIMGSQQVICHGQGTVAITFEGPPYQPPKTVSLVQSYSECGMWFGPMDSIGFVRNGGGFNTSTGDDYPNNETAYVQGGLLSKMSFGYEDGSTFGLLSMDTARYLVVYEDVDLTIVGYLSNGDTVSATFPAALSGDVTFHTRYFGPEWASDLTRVEIPVGSWSMDNLVVIIPEPATGALLIAGAVTVLAFRKGRMRR